MNSSSTTSSCRPTSTANGGSARRCRRRSGEGWWRPRRRWPGASLCWSRVSLAPLAVVAVEEIGVADIELVAAVLWVCGKAKCRVNNGGDMHVLQTLVRLLAKSVKDRTPCDLMCWVNDAPELQPARDTMFEANELERFELYVAPEKF